MQIGLSNPQVLRVSRLSGLGVGQSGAMSGFGSQKNPYGVPGAKSSAEPDKVALTTAQLSAFGRLLLGVEQLNSEVRRMKQSLGDALSDRSFSVELRQLMLGYAALEPLATAWQKQLLEVERSGETSAYQSGVALAQGMTQAEGAVFVSLAEQLGAALEANDAVGQFERFAAALHVMCDRIPGISHTAGGTAEARMLISTIQRGFRALGARLTYIK